MYSVSQNFWNSVWNPSRSVSLEIQIYGTKQGSATQVLGIQKIKSIAFVDKLMSDSKFEFGNATMRTLNFSFFDEQGSVSSIGLGGATLDLYLILNSIKVFYGRYYINEVYENGIVVNCESCDAMAFSDVVYIPSVAFPTTLYLLAQDVARCSGLTLVAPSIPNGNLTITEPIPDITCRQMFQYIAQISGTYAKAPRTQSKDVTFVNLVETQKTVPLGAVFSLENAENPISVTGVVYGENYIVGTEDYAVLLPDNPILNQLEETDISNVLSSLLTKYSNISYYPAKTSINSNAAFESGDIITVTNRSGKTFQVIASQISFSGMSQMKITSAGATKEQNKYIHKGSLSAKVTEILKDINKIEKELIPTIEQTIVSSTEKITSAISGYIYIPESGDPYGLNTGQLLVMDDPIPTRAAKVWRWNLGGLGYSKNGVDGPFETAITQDGEIVANFITSGIMNADVIRTGTISSSNGASWLNLDNGTFNLGNSGFSYDGNSLNITASNIQKKSGEVSSPLASESDVDNAVSGVQENVAQIQKAINEQKGFIKLNAEEPSLTLGKEGASAKVVITDEALTLTGSDNAIATLGSSRLNVQQLELEKLYFKNKLVLMIGNNNHLSIKKV